MTSADEPLRQDGIRFLLAGIINTLLTLAIYQMSLFICSPSIAYAVSWLCGLVFVVVFYPDRVFAGGRKDTLSRMMLSISYIVVFLLGIGALKLLNLLSLQPRFSIIFVLIITSAANFIVARLLLRASSKPI